jgi:tRNA(fMet)-specific endonuclease VapC
MSLYVLDSDILTLLRHNDPNLTQRIQAHAGDVLAVAVISAQEVIAGWLNQINRQTRPDRIAHAYEEFTEAVSLLGGFTILPYRESTMILFQQLLAMKLNVGKNDLRIGAIALEHSAVVVTRNLRDFARIPGLTAENWAA